MQGDAKVVRRPDVTLNVTGDEALLLDNASGSVHVVNRTAATVWELCADEPTLDELVTAVAGTYGIAEDEVRGDVEAMVGTFGGLGLLSVGS